ncbi:MAG: hypothetical protein JRG86_00745, partial [Deltaproteobacteria bacterium]|nr:hypothetical protein [Deltaproteobacteria bacterium]
SRVACNSAQNAAGSDAATHLVRVTHPFHPLSGRSLACVGERYNRSGTWLLLEVDEESSCLVPPRWTDRAAPDPEVVLGEGRACFRVRDLVDLAGLVARLVGREAPDGV